MQLICMICSSFKKVFKSSISELRSESRSTNPQHGLTNPEAGSTNPQHGLTNPQTGSTNPANPARPDLDPVFESLEDDFDDKRKNPETLKEVKSVFVRPSVRLIVCPSVHMSICPSFSLFLSFSFCPFLFLFDCHFVRPSLCLSLNFPPIINLT
jgi:hypothetical protein